MKDAKNKPDRKFWEFRAAAGNPKVGELLLYGFISNYSWFGDEVTAKQFAEDLKALGDIDELTVYINSPGGDVWAGQAIHSQLKRHKANITVYVDGLAASIASVVAMAGDTVIMPKNSMMMVHQPWAWTAGNAKDFREYADHLDKVATTIVATYLEKTGLEEEEIIKFMDEEKWMDAEEAVELGFADKVDEEKKIAASLDMDGGKIVINGHEVEIPAYRNFPKDKFPVATSEPLPTPPTVAQDSDPPAPPPTDPNSNVAVDPPTAPPADPQMDPPAKASDPPITNPPPAVQAPPGDSSADVELQAQLDLLRMRSQAVKHEAEAAHQLATSRSPEPH